MEKCKLIKIVNDNIGCYDGSGGMLVISEPDPNQQINGEYEVIINKVTGFTITDNKTYPTTLAVANLVNINADKYYNYEQLLAANLDALVKLEKDASLKLDGAALKDKKDHLAEIVAKIYYVRRNAGEMVKLLEKANKVSNEERAEIYFNELKPLMEHIRKHVDQLECVVSDDAWDLPKYREMLFIK
jgi:hypothetical protein